MNETYAIQVSPEPVNHSRIEDAFVKAAKHLLNECRFEQIEDSRLDAFSHGKLISSLDRQISNFQYIIHKMDIQRQDDKKLTDSFENTIKETAVHM